jgi:hypothetical protein
MTNALDPSLNNTLCSYSRNSNSNVANCKKDFSDLKIGSTDICTIRRDFCGHYHLQPESELQTYVQKSFEKYVQHDLCSLYEYNDGTDTVRPANYPIDLELLNGAKPAIKQ